jgi:quercetin dioxygenase-like cupin family protein
MAQPTYVAGVIGMIEPFEDKPRAHHVLQVPETHVVAFAFAAGQELHEHQAHHPVLVQALAGHLRLSHGEAEVDLRPGDLLHLPAMTAHSVTAIEDSTLTVTMLLKSRGGAPDDEVVDVEAGAN